MEPVLKKGKLIDWKDDRGFGFIKPDDVDKKVFLHISVLNRTDRRPKIGDIIFYERVIEQDGKLRATRASIQGVKNRPFSRKQKPKRESIAKTIFGVIMVPIITLFGIESRPSNYPSPITLITKPGCTIKGNISIETSNKIYHLPDHSAQSCFRK